MKGSAIAVILDIKMREQRERLRLDVVTLGRDVATVTVVYKVRGQDKTGRQTQTWVRFPDAGWKVIAAHVSMIAEQPVL